MRLREPGGMKGLLQVRKMTWIYVITLITLTALTAATYAWRQHLIQEAYRTVAIASHAGKNNHGVASNYANEIAGMANSMRFWFALFTALTSAVAVVGLMEYVILPFLNMSRVGAVTRVTYHEALLQPFTLIVLALCLAAVIITAFVPFNTFGEDTKMYRDVALSFVLMFILVIMVFATGKVIDEEIENRTMLTLMSKPIARWQVVLGKYLGVLCLIFVTMAVTTIAAAAAAWVRYFSDQRIAIDVASVAGRELLFWENKQAILAMIPAFVLQFMELGTLAAISTAIATRFGLALNMTAIIALYIGANLTRFVPLLHLGAPWQSIANSASYLLPYLSNFDINQCLVYRHITIGSHYVKGAPTYSQIWRYVGLATLYGLFYIGASLSLAIALFRNRELT